MSYYNKHDFIRALYDNKINFNGANQVSSLFSKNELDPLIESYHKLYRFVDHYRYLNDLHDLLKDFNPLTSDQKLIPALILNKIISSKMSVSAIVSIANDFNELLLDYKSNLRDVREKFQERFEQKQKRKKEWALTVLRFSNMPDWAKEYLSQ